MRRTKSLGDSCREPSQEYNLVEEGGEKRRRSGELKVTTTATGCHALCQV